MKYLRLTSSGQKLGTLVKEGLLRVQNRMSQSAEKTFAEARVYVNERRTDRFLMTVKEKAMVTVLMPVQCFKQRVFLLKSEDIAFEDENIVVVDKPVGLPTQGTLVLGEDHLYGTLIAHYTAKHPQRLAYVGMHHRLDRDTSGLVLFTRKPSMNKSIADQFKDHTIQKKYLAVVQGDKPEREQWVVQAAIGRDRTASKGEFRFKVDPRKGDPAETRFTYVKALDSGRHLIECSPITGRTHQIRVHLHHSGLPIVGDRVYGVPGAERMMLHAHSLSFSHPKTEKKMTVTSKRHFQV